MQKNVAGQKIGCQMVSATDGSAFTSAVTVYVTGDAGTQAAGSVGSGACTHEGNGYHTYAPAQAETNYDLVAFTFIGSGAVPATVQVFTSYPQTGDSYTRLGAPAGASVSADVAAVKAQTAAIEADTQDLQAQIGTDGAGLTNMPWNAAWDAEVESEVTDALNAYDPPTNAEMVARTLAAAAYFDPATDTVAAVTVVGSVAGAVGSVTGNVGGSVASVAANGITAASIAADAINAAAVKTDAVTKIQNGLATPTNITAGTITTVTNLTNAPTNGDLTATMKTSVTTAATAATPIAAAVTGAVGSVTSPVTAGTVSDKTGYALSSAGIQAIWDALTSALITVGSIGKLLVDNINATISSRSTYAGGDTSGTTTLLSRIVGTLASGTHNAQSGDAFARLGAPAGASVSADVAAVKSQTAAIETDTQDLQTQIGTAGAGLTVLASQASVGDLPTNAELATALAGADDTVLAAIADVPTLAEFEARTLPSADYTVVSDLPTTGAIADAVWDEALSGHSTPGTSGAILIDIIDDTSTTLMLAIAGIGTPPTANAIADAVWDEALSEHSTAGTTGKKLTDLANADLSGVATAASIAALNNLSSAQAQTAATAALNAYDPPTNAEMEARTLVAANYATAAALDAVDNYVDSEVAAIKAVTDKIDTALALDGAVYQLTANALELAPTGSGASAGDIADAVWDEALSGHSTAGTAGKKLTDLANADLSGVATAASIAALNNLSSAQAQTAATAALNAYDPPTNAEMEARTLVAANYATAAALDAVEDTVEAIKYITDTLDVTAITQVPASIAGHLTITAGITFTESVSGLTIPADWVAAIWTLKQNVRDTDLAAVLQLRTTNPAAGSDGLQRLNGAVPVTPLTMASGVLTVSQATGTITIYLTDELTTQLAKADDLGWDVKFIDADGDSTGRRGTADVVLTETKATA